MIWSRKKEPSETWQMGMEITSASSRAKSIAPMYFFAFWKDYLPISFSRFSIGKSGLKSDGLDFTLTHSLAAG